MEKPEPPQLEAAIDEKAPAQEPAEPTPAAEPQPA